MTELTYRSGSGYQIHANLGIVPDACGVAAAESYPFVVGILDAVPSAGITSYGEAHFPDICGAVVTGTATPF